MSFLFEITVFFHDQIQIDDDEKETEKRDTKDVEPPKRSDEDEDDDIIDLGKDEELDFDMKHEETPEPKVY